MDIQIFHTDQNKYIKKIVLNYIYEYELITIYEYN